MELSEFLASDLGRRLTTEGKLVASRVWSDDERRDKAPALSLPDVFLPSGGGCVLEHPCIAFPSFPHEWCPSQVAAAGKLTMEIARAAFAEGWGLKDATPNNVLFDGCRPVFVDVPSFEKRDPRDPIWTPYAQFVRTFLLPLLAHKTWGHSMSDVFLTRRDGLEPEELYRFAGWFRRLSPGFLTRVSLPVWLSGRHPGRDDGGGAHALMVRRNPDQARYILGEQLRRLARSLERLSPEQRTGTIWSGYMEEHSYSPREFRAKEEFIGAVLQEAPPSWVLDAGANTGHFSVQAARAGARVVAVDFDADCVDALHRRAEKESLDILALVQNLARPSPAVGWLNRESPSFLERARGHFDGLFMLALMHHLLVTERIPLEGILDLAAEWTRDWAVIEYVDPSDPMFRALTRGRGHLHADFNRDTFESACSRHFDIQRSCVMDGAHRVLYWLRKKQGRV